MKYLLAAVCILAMLFVMAPTADAGGCAVNGFNSFSGGYGYGGGFNRVQSFRSFNNGYGGFNSYSHSSFNVVPQFRTQRVFVGYDVFGRPVFRFRTVGY